MLLLPFFGLTSAIGVAYGVPEGDYNARLTILGSFFVASLALRYISVQYLPRVSYATLLDWYIQSCLFFTLAGVLEVVLAFNLFYTPPNPLPPYTTLPQPDGTALNVYPAQPSPKLHSDFDTACWLTMLVLWALTNLYFAVHFTSNYVAYAHLQEAQDARITARRDLILGLHPHRATASAARRAGTLTCCERLEIAQNHCCRAGGGRRFCATLLRTLWRFAVNLGHALIMLPLLLDALLLCRCCSNACDRWRAAGDHHILHHQGELKRDLHPGMALHYETHEVKRLYGVSTRKNRTS